MFDAPAKPVTAEAFITFITQPENEGRRFELIDGEIVERSSTQLQALVASFLNAVLYSYFKDHSTAWVFANVSVKLPYDNLNDTIPGVSVVLKEGREFNPNEPLDFMPDLAIEIKSPTDSLLKMRKKANYYLENGSRLVWLVDTQRKKVEVYTVDDTEILGSNDILDGGDLLPDFKLSVSELWSQQ